MVVGKTLYNTDVKIETLDQENEDNMDHIIMRLHFNNMRFTKADPAPSSPHAIWTRSRCSTT